MNIDIGSSFHFAIPRRYLIFFHDLIVLTLSFPLAVLLREDGQLANWQLEPLVHGIPTLVVIASVTFILLGLHRGMWTYASPKDLLLAIKAVTIVLVAFVCTMFLIGRLDGIARGALPILWCLAVAGLCGSRILYSSYQNKIQARLRQDGGEGRTPRVLIVGDEDAVALVAYLTGHENVAHSHIVGLISNNRAIGRTLYGVPVLGSIECVESILARLDAKGLKPSNIVLAGPRSELGAERLEDIMAAAQSAGIRVHEGPNILGSTLALPKANIHHQPFRTSRELETLDLFVPWYHRVRRPIDAILAGILLVLISPILLILTMAVTLTIGSPVYFDQCRPGRLKKDFMLHKLRTMIDPMTADGRLLGDDERLTSLGIFLRRTRLDELPQIWNVFVGHMALVGPRPLLPRDLPDVDQALLQERFTVRPGLTGWAQVNGGKKLNAEEKLALDLFYVRNASIWLDIRILAMTLKMMLFGEEVNTVEIDRAKVTIAAA